MEGARDGIDKSVLWEGTTIPEGGITAAAEDGIAAVAVEGGIAAVAAACGGIAASAVTTGGIAASAVTTGGIAASANDSCRVVRINTAINTINRPMIDNLMTISTGSPCKI
jgi:hypothetical protein